MGHQGDLTRQGWPSSCRPGRFIGKTAWHTAPRQAFNRGGDHRRRRAGL